MDFIVEPDGRLIMDRSSFRCALGRSGVSRYKREGDGMTPAGSFPLRRLYYRADRMPAPATGLPLSVITAADGWCDDAGCADYNCPVTLPHGGSYEHLHRADRCYDIVVVIGYNDDPPVSGLGSAIFMHLAAPGYAPTEGCVALALQDLLSVIAGCDISARLLINPSK
ncbi:MAG: L,D-transpeptidase family protein [Rhodospirillales bacterium]|jgi:L,D-peptidoglycan transpeptidase YkuD (ErfK/YbiS/YcfS/YnhG family)|nr:hypothetical protein [Rhodospirillaceae bacterium]MDP6428367.1 L,D-transpeptidase family protein [Rhodospirillales bacterium]MDP6642847.1 L,D-transpeptidase family protein [Rhodospirillales bacterium]MDP6842924.1 L,D-transpeptidase family protein [Rhodospirillales bacterium]